MRDPSAAIHGNKTGQILCCTQAMAAFAALRHGLGQRFVLAGYSVGELAAWGCAGLYDPATLIGLAVQRAEAMDRASGPDDGLAFVRGLGRAVIDELCERHDAAVAIVNPGDMVVIGGTRQALAALIDAAATAGAAKVGMLKVAIASHTPKLAEASTRFRRALSVPTARLPPRVRLISGIDGMAAQANAEGLDKLAAQISQTIQWAACLEACVEAGVDTVLELGPGNALAAMVGAAYPSLNARSVDDFRSLAGVETWLARALH